MRKLLKSILFTASILTLAVSCKDDEPLVALEVTVVAPATVKLGTADAAVEFTLKAVATTDVTINIANDNAEALTVAETAVIAAGQTSTKVLLVVKAAGTSKLSYTSADAELSIKESSIEVTALPFVPSDVTVVTPTDIELGTTGKEIVFSIAAASSKDITINIANDKEDVLTVEKAIIIKTGETSAKVALTTKAVGTVKLAFTSTEGKLLTADATINVTAAKITAVAPANIKFGATDAKLIFSIPSAQTEDVVITITNDNADVLTVPATATIEATKTSVEVAIATVSAGAANLTFTSEVVEFNTATLAINVVLPEVTVKAPSSILLRAADGVIKFSIPAVESKDIIVNIANDNVTALTVPATVTILTGETSAEVAIATIAGGTSKLTFTSSDATLKTLEASINVEVTYTYASTINGSYTGMTTLVIGETTLTSSCVAGTSERGVTGNNDFALKNPLSVNDDRISEVVTIAEGTAIVVNYDPFAYPGKDGYEIVLFADMNGDGLFPENEILFKNILADGGDVVAIDGVLSALAANAVQSGRARLVIARKQQPGGLTITDGSAAYGAGYFMDFTFTTK